MSNPNKRTRSNKLTTIKNMVKLAPYEGAFSEASLRSLIFHSVQRKNKQGHLIPANGLQEAGSIIRIGRKVLIDINSFDAWLANQSQYGKGGREL